MRFLSRSMVALARFGLIALAATACATGGDGLAPSASFTTLMPGWESKFSVDWKVTPAPDGSQLIFGRVTSTTASTRSPSCSSGSPSTPRGAW
jgi:hypothetical protein